MGFSLPKQNGRTVIGLCWKQRALHSIRGLPIKSSYVNFPETDKPFFFNHLIKT